MPTLCWADTTYSGEVSIPATFYNGLYANVRLDTYAFVNCVNVTKFVIPASVETVYGAFQNCSALATISFAASKITFNENAFVNCPSFTAFKLTGDVAASYAVEGGALYNPAKTQLIRVPTGLTAPAIPDTVTAIGPYAFAYSKIKSVALPAALQEISVSAFTSASKFESFTISDANATYAARNGVLYSKDLETLIRVPPACTNLIVLAGVTNIADNACLGCTALKTVTCPASLTHLETYAFQEATAIKTITFNSNLPTLRTQEMLGSLTLDATVRYPKRYAGNWKTYLNAHGYKFHEPIKPKGCFFQSAPWKQAAQRPHSRHHPPTGNPCPGVSSHRNRVTGSATQCSLILMASLPRPVRPRGAAPRPIRPIRPSHYRGSRACPRPLSPTP